MKTLLVFAFVVILALANGGLTPEQKQKVKENNQECMKETGISEEKVKKLQKGDFSNDDEDVQKYLLCMLTKANLMTEDGRFKKDEAMTHVSSNEDKDKISDAIDACIDEKGATTHETAYLFIKCFHGQYPEFELFTA